MNEKEMIEAYVQRMRAYAEKYPDDFSDLFVFPPKEDMELLKQAAIRTPYFVKAIVEVARRKEGIDE